MMVECVEDALQSDQLELAQQTVTEIISERERLASELQRYDFVSKVWPSNANFLLIRVTDSAQVMQRCAEQKVLLRHFGGDLDDCIRVSIGSPDENSKLLQVLDQLKEESDA